MIRKKAGMVMLLMMVMILTGCWDAIEIEDRAIVTSLAIDKYIPSPSQEIEEEGRLPNDVSRNRFIFTYGLPSAMFLQGKGEEANIVYQTVGENLFSASRIMATRLGMQVFLGHLDAIVIGESVAKDSHLFREILDAIERDSLITRRASLVIAPESAAEVLKVQQSLLPFTGDFITKIFRNKDRSYRSGTGNIGHVLENLYATGATTISRIIPGKEDLKVAGAAVIKDYQLRGWLGEIETRAVEIIKGRPVDAGISIEYGKTDARIVSGEAAHGHDYHIIPIRLEYKTTKFHLQGEDPISIRIEVIADGGIQQFYFDPEQDLLNPELIHRVEEKASKAIQEELEGTIKKLQEEFQTDVIGVGRYISRYHPKLWKKIEKEWKETFPTIEIVVDVKMQIRRVGLSK